MKKYFIGILLILCISAYTQKDIKTEIYTGFTVGMNRSWLYFNPVESIVLLPGYTGGISFVYISEPHLGVKLEFNYSEKGWENAFIDESYYSRRLNYFEIPFMTYIVLGKNKFKYTFDLGPYVSYLLSEKEQTNIPPIEYPFINKKADSDWDFGFCGGMGPAVKLKNHVFGLEARVFSNFNNLFRASSDFKYLTTKNQVISFRFYYQIKVF